MVAEAEAVAEAAVGVFGRSAQGVCVRACGGGVLQFVYGLGFRVQGT